MIRAVETVIVGAGQAGLVMSDLLRQAGREHVLLERRSTLGGGWQDRWDAFRLVSPNWTVSMPGLAYAGDEPDGFMPRDELIGHFRSYAWAIEAPVELATEVRRLASCDVGSTRFELTTSHGSIRARDVIVAGGPFQRPHVPDMAGSLAADIASLHAHDYRNPESLPPGGVLLVGSGQTGVQLAEELIDAGRQVTIAAGRCGSAPRRYRGRDAFWWLRQLAVRGDELGAPLPSADRLPSPQARFACNPQLSGHRGGHDVDLRVLAATGIRIVGRLEALEGHRARFRGDLAETLTYSDAFFEERLRPLFDTFAERSGETFPPDERQPIRDDLPEITGLDIAAEGISTVIWTSGYRPAFDWIELPVLDPWGLPERAVGEPAGVTAVPGLSFIGTPWLRDMGSANLIGLVRDAEALAARW